MQPRDLVGGEFEIGLDRGDVDRSGSGREAEKRWSSSGMR
jgi:hypothetical protein